MAITTEKLEMKSMPCVPLRGVVVFPMIPITFEVTDKKWIRVCERAVQNNSELLFVTQREMQPDDPAEGDLFRFGTVLSAIIALIALIRPRITR